MTYPYITFFEVQYWYSNGKAGRTYYDKLSSANAALEWLRDHEENDSYKLTKICIPTPNRWILVAMLNGNMARHIASQEVLNVWARTNGEKATTSSAK